MKLITALLLLTPFAALLSPARGDTLLHDTFDAWNETHWRIPTWSPSGNTFLGRTQLRVSQQPWRPACDGALTLTLDTWNPSAQTPGDSFYGSEIISQQAFSPPSGQEQYVFSARFRLPQSDLPGGMVASMFLYQAENVTTVRDEVDFELLTNDLAGVSTNVFNQSPFSDPGDWVFHSIPTLNVTAWNTMTLTWDDELVWKLNGQELRRESGAIVPDSHPVNLRFNLWAPADTWPAAYNGAFQPAINEADNDIYTYQLDWVTIEHTIPEPASLSLLALGVLSTLRRRKQR
jgi:hypothetical protein